MEGVASRLDRIECMLGVLLQRESEEPVEPAVDRRGSVLAAMIVALEACGVPVERAEVEKWIAENSGHVLGLHSGSDIAGLAEVVCRLLNETLEGRNNYFAEHFDGMKPFQQPFGLPAVEQESEEVREFKAAIAAEQRREARKRERKAGRQGGGGKPGGSRKRKEDDK